MTRIDVSNMTQFAARDFRAPVRAGDYIGEDGLLRCGKCGTPRECRVSTHGNGGLGLKGVKWDAKNERTVIRPTMCRCEMTRIESEERDREDAARNEMERVRRARCFDNRGLASCTFDADDSADSEPSREARAYCAAFVENRREGNGLIFLGGVGCGKTFYAACIANDLLDRGMKVRVTSLSALSGGTQVGDGLPRAIKELKSCDLVVLDDLGTERDTPYANECCYQIVNALTTDRIPIVATSNMTLAELGSQTGGESDRVKSRIIERCRPVVMCGPDRRRPVLR